MSRWFPFAVLWVIVSACGGNSPTAPTLPSGLTITGPESVLTGTVIAFIAWAKLEDGSILRGAPAEWTTSDSTVASIDAKGVLTGQGPGIVTVTATWRDRTASITVRVSRDTAANGYLTSLLDIMQANSAYSTTVDWASLRGRVFAAAEGASTIAGTFPAIRLALDSLPDHESFYLGHGGVTIRTGDESCIAPTPSLPELPSTIAYVRVEACPCLGDAGTGYANALQQTVKDADRTGLSGWLIDLRGNMGGNMWPMIAGIGPVLGEGNLGWIVYNDREYEREYHQGAALSLGEAFARVSTPYTLKEPPKRVAVLTDGRTYSSGEAIAVYFRGRPATRSFGAPTCGHHHLQSSFDLSDGAILQLTTARHADRLRRLYGGPIAPDEIAVDPDQAVSRAIAWLHAGG